MKKLSIFLISCLITIFLKAQNGGQFNENNALRIEVASVVNGVVTVKVTNKQSCRAEVEITNASVTKFKVNAHDFKLITLNSGATFTKVKPKTNCNPGCTDMGWLELVITALPIRAGSVTALYVGDNQVKIDFDAYDTPAGTYFYIDYSLDGKTWKTATFFSAEQYALKHYSKTIKIK